jgi:hypothetical protein
MVGPWGGSLRRGKGKSAGRGGPALPFDNSAGRGLPGVALREAWAAQPYRLDR